MKKYRCDLHIHSALSPCADDDMTPGNIVAMSKLKGLDVIALTDHQSLGNVRSAMKFADEFNIKVIPGMELETAEEFHSICLFPELEAAEEFEKIVQSLMPKILVKEEIFGSQWYFDENDDKTHKEKYLLTVASRLTFEEAQAFVRDLRGVIIPAHIDRSSYSIISVLGGIPEEFRGNCLEISSICNLNMFLKQYPEIKNFRLISSSDAHYLKDISEAGHLVEIAQYNPSESTISSIINALID